MNYTGVIAQLNAAREHCERTIGAMKKASEADHVDRSNSIASVERDLASFNKQLAEFQSKEETASKAASEKPTKPNTKP